MQKKVKVAYTDASFNHGNFFNILRDVLFKSYTTCHLSLHNVHYGENSTHTCHPFVNRQAWLVYRVQKGLDIQSLNVWLAAQV